MPLFTSRRERRLWLWTLAVVVAIYSTLGLTVRLSGVLRERGLVEEAFLLGMLMIGAAIVALQLKARPGWAELGVWLGVAAVYLLVFVRMAVPEERTHLIEYSVVAALLYEALTERVKGGRRVWAPAVLAVLATALIGWLDEGIQAILPNRVYDLVDVGFNALAGLMAVVASVVLARVRAWVRQRQGNGSERRQARSDRGPNDP